MTIEAIILGIIQGLTEFLPISSSGHLAITHHILAMKEELILMNVCLHVGTLFAIVVYFFKDIVAVFKDGKYLLSIGVATIITGVFGVMFKDFLESLFYRPILIFVMLIINGLVLLSTRQKKTKAKDIGVKEAICVGLAQCLAIIPGISRSGITISSMIHLGIDRKEAFRFSFLMVIPVISGAFLLKWKEAASTSDIPFITLGIGTFFSFAFGYFALKWLKHFIDQTKMYMFGYYCIVFGVLSMLLLS